MSAPTQVEPAPTPMGALVTPDPARTTESFVALAATLIPALLVLFKLHVSDAEQAALLTALGAIYAAFTLWHAKGVRAARAIAKGLGGGGASPSIKP